MRGKIHRYSWKVVAGAAVTWAGIHLVRGQQPTHTWYDLVLYVVFGLGILLWLATWESLTFRRWTVQVGNQGGKPGIWLDPPKKTGSKKALDRETAKLVYDIFSITVTHGVTQLPPEDIELVEEARRKAIEDGVLEEDAASNQAMWTFNDLHLKRSIEAEEELQERIAVLADKYVQRGMLTTAEAESLTATRLVPRPWKPGESLIFATESKPFVWERLEELRKQL